MNQSNSPPPPLIHPRPPPFLPSLLSAVNAGDPDYVTGSRGRLVLWSMYGEEVLYDPKHVERTLTFDPSLAPHHYRLEVYAVADEEAAVRTPGGCC